MHIIILSKLSYVKLKIMTTQNHYHIEKKKIAWCLGNPVLTFVIGNIHLRIYSENNCSHRYIVLVNLYLEEITLTPDTAAHIA